MVDGILVPGTTIGEVNLKEIFGPAGYSASDLQTLSDPKSLENALKQQLGYKNFAGDLLPGNRAMLLNFLAKNAREQRVDRLLPSSPERQSKSGRVGIPLTKAEIKARKRSGKGKYPSLSNNRARAIVELAEYAQELDKQGLPLPAALERLGVNLGAAQGSPTTSQLMQKDVQIYRPSLSPAKLNPQEKSFKGWIEGKGRVPGIARRGAATQIADIGSLSSYNPSVLTADEAIFQGQFGRQPGLESEVHSRNVGGIQKLEQERQTMDRMIREAYPSKVPYKQGSPAAGGLEALISPQAREGKRIPPPPHSSAIPQNLVYKGHPIGDLLTGSNQVFANLPKGKRPPLPGAEKTDLANRAMIEHRKNPVYIKERAQQAKGLNIGKLTESSMAQLVKAITAGSLSKIGNTTVTKKDSTRKIAALVKFLNKQGISIPKGGGINPRNLGLLLALLGGTGATMLAGNNQGGSA